MKPKEKYDYSAEFDYQEPDPEEGEYIAPLPQQRVAPGVKGKISEAVGSLKIGKRTEAAVIAVKRNRTEGIKAAVRGLLVAMLEPENVIEDDMLWKRTQERRGQMAKDRQAAQNYIKIGDAYYQHVAQQYLDHIDNQTWEAFYEQNLIPQEYRYKHTLFGFFSSWGDYRKPSYHITDEARNQLLVSLAQLVFSEHTETISKASVDV